MKIKFSEKGISLLFIILIMSVILAIGLGISGILVQQIKTTEQIGYSVVSFYAADSGVEQELYELYREETPQSYFPNIPVGSAMYTVKAKCGGNVALGECAFGDSEIDPDCTAANYCIKSIGSYQGTNRAIKTQY
ncbi:MAG: hypothetical protein ABIG08_03615 [bacterium]